MEQSTHTSHELLLKKKKRRRRKRILIVLAVLICFLAAGGGALLFRQRSLRASQETVRIEAGEGETITYARIDTIVGNEIEVSLLKEASDGSEKEEQTEAGTQTPDMETPEGNGPASELSGEDMPDGSGTAPEGGMPDGSGFAPGGDMPDGSGFMPDDSGFAPGGDMPDEAGFPPEGNQTDRASYVETGEMREWQIPVGTDVITTLGVDTTFSRLSAGDVIAVLTEADTDNILKIWIVQ